MTERAPAIVRARVVPRAAAYTLRIAYLLVIAAATLRGLAPEVDRELVALRLHRAFHQVVGPGDVVDGVRNVALFAGLGAIWIATTASHRLRRGLWRATLAGGLASLVVETVQLVSTTRYTSLLDLTTNTLGALLGAFAAAVAIALARSPRRVALAPPPLVLVALPYALACAGEALSPFGRVDQVLGAWGGPGVRWAAAVADLRAHPMRAGGWIDALLVAPVGMLLVLLAVERGVRARRAAWAVTLVGPVAWALVEGARGASGGDLAPLAVVVRSVVVAVTAWATAAWLGDEGHGAADVRRTLARRGPLVMTLLLLLWSWRPLALVGSAAEAVAKLGRDAFVPLAALSQARTLHSAIDVVVGFLLYVPVGAWLGARVAPDGKPSGPWALWPGLLLAVASEAGQVVVATRTLDVTDALVQCAGVLVGWAVLRLAAARARTPLVVPAESLGTARP